MKQTPLNLTDRIRVIANVHDLDTNRYSVELEFCDVKGGWVKELLPRSIIRSGVSALDELLDRGAHLPTAPGAGAQLASLLSVVPDRTYRIIGKTGWHGKSFVLPDITIGPDANTLIHASRKSSKPFELPTQGNLDGWRDGLKDPCRASSYLTFGIGLAFAGPMLHVVGQDEGAIFYLAGESSTGKTLTELAAQSVIERAVRGALLTHDASNGQSRCSPGAALPAEKERYERSPARRAAEPARSKDGRLDRELVDPPDSNRPTWPKGQRWLLTTD